jgi:WD40 repeat protein
MAPPLEDPYVGLTYFTEEYVDFFFGRDTESVLIIGNLRAARLTLLYAESGVGKSSVLRAGVVARLREFADRDLGSRGSPRLVPVVLSSWSERPVAALIHAIDEAIRPHLAQEDVPDLPEGDLEAALEAASEALDATLLVILDQFEEYFLYPDEEPEQDRVAAQLARCVSRPDLRANFLISIREDAYAELGDLFRGKVKNVYGNFLHLDFLDRAGAREAIERPIERVNELQPDADPFGLEPALVDTVLDQVGRDESDDRIETTYLQLVMRRLWEEEEGAGSRVLRLRTLDELGGAQAIIGSHLDRAMEGGAGGDAGLSRDQRRIAAATFRFLVTSGGAKIALTADDLADLSSFSTAEIQPVLRHLSSPELHILRPVVFEEEGSEPRYEIFHDALADPILEWRTRVEEEERDARVKRERADKEKAQRAAAEAERQALRERQRKRLAQGLLALAVFALLVGASFFALEQKDLADQRKADSQSVRAAERISELVQVPSFGPVAAALAGVEAYRLSATDEARERTLAQLQLNPGFPAIMVGHTSGVESVAYWPRSDKLASGSDKTVRLWKEDGEEIRPLLAAGSNVLEVAVSERRRDGTRIVVAGLESGPAEFWEITEAGKPAVGGKRNAAKLEGSPSGARGVAFSPAEPDLLAIGGEDGRLVLWRLEDPRRPRPAGVRRVAGEVEDLAFAADGHSLFVAGSGGGEVFELAGGGFAGSGSSLSPAEASAVAAAPDGSYAFAGGGGIELWDARGRRSRLRLPGKVHGLAFASGGSVLVSGGSDWNVTTWDVAKRRPFGPPRAANRAAIKDVAVSSESAKVAAGSDDRLVRAWPLEPPLALATTIGGLSPGELDGGVAKVHDLVVGGDGRIVTSVGPAGTLIWSPRDPADTDSTPAPVDRLRGKSTDAAYHDNVLVTGKENSFVVYGTGPPCEDRRLDPCPLDKPEFPRSDGTAGGFVFAPEEGQLLLASTGRRGRKGVLNLWDLDAVAHRGGVVHLASKETPAHLSEIAFDGARSLIAAADADGELLVWDVSRRKRPRPVEPHGRGETEAHGIRSVAFSPDGSWLATGGEDRQVSLWRVTGEEGAATVEETPGTLLQREVITALAFSLDGKTLAAADGGGNVCLYELEGRHLIGDRSCLRGHDLPGSRERRERGVEEMRFVRHGDSTVLLTAGKGQPVIVWSSLLWNLDDSEGVEEEITKRVCALAGRNLTAGERETVFTSTKIEDDGHQPCPIPVSRR